jgi:hypothetical protein
MDNKHGKLIDTFPEVVRFNDCHLDGNEPFTGCKTHTWFTVMFYNVNLIRHLTPLKRVVAHSWQQDPLKCKTYQSYLPKLPGRVEKLDHSIILEMSRYLGDEKYRTWSTGALAIWHYVKKLEKFPPLSRAVHITGFDWWDRKEHHHSDKAPRGGMHKPDIEKRFVDKLVKDHLVRFL